LFLPSLECALQLDTEMRAQLASSLAHIAEQIEGLLPAESNLISRCLKIVQSRAVSPLVFVHYYDLVLAIQQDQMERVVDLVKRLVQACEIMPNFEVRDLSADDLGKDLASYSEKLDIDPDIPLDLLPPPAEQSALVRDRIVTAQKLIAQASPELSSELSALIKQIILAKGPDKPGAAVFDGVSSFMVWGAILLNAETHKTVIEVAQALVHESAHNLLFGHSIDEPLVNDDAEELYSSPLRVDPRPMDGIYHATFVLARMCFVLEKLLIPGNLDAAQTEEAEKSLYQNIQRFYSGHKVIEANSHKLGALGERLMSSAKSYVDNLAKSVGEAACVTH